MTSIKDAADDVIADLKVLCMDVLLKPNTDYTTLLKYGYRKEYMIAPSKIVVHINMHIFIRTEN
jgi:hypothetical protein